MRVRGPNVPLTVVMFAFATTALLPDCIDYFVLEGHLKDNPMDQAIASGMESTHLKSTRGELLRRIPPGQLVVKARRYLESVGATCRSPRRSNAAIVCDYRQEQKMVLRTPIGDFPSTTSLYDFRILLAASGRHLSGIEVCQRITRVYYREPSDEPVRKRTYPFECTTDPKPE